MSCLCVVRSLSSSSPISDIWYVLDVSSRRCQFTVLDELTVRGGYRANIARIMKNAVPGTSKISKEAKDAVQECVSEFISFITSEAAEKCHEEKRKTIGGEDVLYAMMMLGFEQYVEPLKIYLSKMRQVRPLVVFRLLLLPTPLSFGVWRRFSDSTAY